MHECQVEQVRERGQHGGRQAGGALQLEPLQRPEAAEVVGPQRRRGRERVQQQRLRDGHVQCGESARVGERGGRTVPQQHAAHAHGLPEARQGGELGGVRRVVAAHLEVGPPHVVDINIAPCKDAERQWERGAGSAPDLTRDGRRIQLTNSLFSFTMAILNIEF